MAQSAFVLRIAPSGIDRVPEALEKDQLIIGWANARGLLDETLEWEAFREVVYGAYHDGEANYRRAGAAAGHIWRFVRGMKPGDLVGICMERSLEMAGSLLAVMMAGGAYVPLDPRHPRERLAQVVQDSGISILLAGRDPSIDTVAKILRVTGPQPLGNEDLPATTAADSLTSTNLPINFSSIGNPSSGSTKA